MPRLQTIGPITHQPSDLGKFTTGIDRGNPIARRKRRKLHAPADEEALTGDIESVGRVAPKAGEGGLNFAAGAGVEHSNLQSEGACRFRYLSQRGFGDRSIRRIDQDDNTNCLGQQIMQEAKPLGHNLSVEGIDAGRIAARPGKAGDQSQLDRVVADAEDDRDRRGRSFCRLGTSAEGGRRDHVHTTADEVIHERRQAMVLALHPVVLDRHVLAFDVAGFVEAFAERSDIAYGVLGRPAIDEADYRRWLLRARRERPGCRRAAEQRNERAPSHSITSSARPSSGSGTVRPNALAVLKLMYSSTLLACWTGRLAGLSPLRIRPV